jgi:hypothetical protein
MFLWKDFLMGRIRKIQNHEEERDRSGKYKKKQEGKNGGKNGGNKRKRDFYVRGGFHTHVFSISWECPAGLPPLCHPPSGEPADVGTSPYNKSA